MKTVAELRNHIEVAESGCHEWTGYVHPSGYGRLSWAGRKQYAHRVLYRLTKGAIPNGLDLDHLCRNRRCVNPDHLEPVTRSENIRRGTGWHSIADANGSKEACKKGHTFDADNTYTTKQGWRACRECHREWSRAWKQKRRTA